MFPITIDALPENFPGYTPTPKFQIGDRVCWYPLPAQDFGIITGLEYAPAAHLQSWAWKYIIWLDRHSPSRLWVITDTAWETDLESLAAVTHPQIGHEQP
ncbi:MAG TPA: hypothetical protein V6C84_02255 [Coleofasciculaceae cyanobacterium]|jgi:hypothetical protein